MFEGRRLCIATMHQKERILAPLFESTFDVECFTPAQLNTDEFGTFSGEIKREKSPLEAAKQKAMRAIELTGCDFAIASEGSFGPHPIAGFFPINEELLLLVDLKNKLEIAVKHVSTDTNFASAEVRDLQQVYEFLERAKFPEHALILRELNGNIICKGLSSTAELLRVFSMMQKNQGGMILETDMRAHHNPTRMQNILACGKKLIKAAQSQCPQCLHPGFVVTETVKGLPCENCSMPTKAILKHVYVCKACNFTKEKSNPHGKVFEEPMFCDFCNP